MNILHRPCNPRNMFCVGRNNYRQYNSCENETTSIDDLTHKYILIHCQLKCVIINIKCYNIPRNNVA